MHILRLTLIGVLCGCDVAYVAVDAATTTPVDAALDAEVEAVVAQVEAEEAADGEEPRTSGGELDEATVLAESQPEDAAPSAEQAVVDPTAPDGPVITLADLLSDEGELDADFFHFHPALSEDGRTILVSEPVRDGRVDRLVFIELPDRRVATFVARYDRALSGPARARLEAQLEAGRFRELPILDVDAVVDGIRFGRDGALLQACRESEQQTCSGLEPGSLLLRYLAPLRGGDGLYAIEMDAVGELHRPEAFGLMVTPDRRWVIAPFAFDFDRCTGWMVMPRYRVIPFPRIEGPAGPTSVRDLRGRD